MGRRPVKSIKHHRPALISKSKIPQRKPIQVPMNIRIPKMCGFGTPFHISVSSCHIKPPTLFKWTSTPGPYPTVVMDGAITHPSHLNKIPNKYAWICESMALTYAVDVKRIMSDPLVHNSYKKIFINKPQ